jgi:hypothetical protein
MPDYNDAAATVFFITVLLCGFLLVSASTPQPSNIVNTTVNYINQMENNTKEETSMSVNINIYDTGAGWALLGFDSNKEDYTAYAPAAPYTKYCYIQCQATFNMDGSLTYIDWENPTYTYLQGIYNGGYIPILQISDPNMNTGINAVALTNYLAILHTWLNGRVIIFALGNENNAVFGVPVTTPPAVFNSLYQTVRGILDANGYTNILLANHFVPSGSDELIYQARLAGYVEGLAYCDILGFSGYSEYAQPGYTYTIEQVFADALWDYNRMGLVKPYFFFEYGTSPTTYWGAPFTPSMVDTTYNLLSSHTFVKAICWYLPADSVNSGGCANELMLQAKAHVSTTNPEPPDPPAVLPWTADFTDASQFTVQSGSWSAAP